MKKVDLTPDLTNPVCGCLPPAALVKFSDEATETVARDKLLAVQLEARLGRGVVYGGGWLSVTTKSRDR